MLRAMTKAPRMRERSVVRLSVIPSTKYSCSGSPPMLAKGNTTRERRGGSRRSGAGGTGVARAVWATSSEKTRIGSAMFFSRMAPRSTAVVSSRPLTCQKACSDRQILPGLQSLPTARQY